jgi:hypothetical protein
MRDTPIYPDCARIDGVRGVAACAILQEIGEWELKRDERKKIKPLTSRFHMLVDGKEMNFFSICCSTYPLSPLILFS